MKTSTMKSIMILMVGLMAIASSTVRAEDEPPVRSISVTGTVETKIAPDQILWSVSLTDTDKDMRAAKAASDKRVKAVVALRDKLGVNEGDFETGTVSIRREYEYDDRGRRGAFKHFVVSRSVTIRQRDLKRFDEFLDALVASTEMEVGFSYESSRMHEVRAETRLKALAQAKDKAKKMADVAGAKLGRVLTIDEHARSGGWQNPMSNAHFSFPQSTPAVDASTDRFVPGAITVQVTVYATFQLE